MNTYEFAGYRREQVSMSASIELISLNLPSSQHFYHGVRLLVQLLLWPLQSENCVQLTYCCHNLVPRELPPPW